MSSTMDPKQLMEAAKTSVDGRFPGAIVEVAANGSAQGWASLVVEPDRAREVAEFLKSDPGLALDYCSNVTGVDWLDREEKTKRKVTEGDQVKEVEEVRKIPGKIEVVYHLYSMRLKHGPVVMRVRTRDRGEGCVAPSLTGVWRSCEFQEREIYDLFGVAFTGHPDLRRILMWDEFKDYPMRRDYRDPDDYEYEPTPHGGVHERAKVHYAKWKGEEATS